MLRDASLREDGLRKQVDQLQRMLDRSEHQINSLQQVGAAEGQCCQFTQTDYPPAVSGLRTILGFIFPLLYIEGEETSSQTCNLNISLYGKNVILLVRIFTPKGESIS